jgi:methylmalonyl-CoA mutase C-terminal domain/subunit
MRARGIMIPVVVGGIVPPRDAEELRAVGIAGVIGPGATAEEVVAVVEAAAATAS